MKILKRLFVIVLLMVAGINQTMAQSGILEANNLSSANIDSYSDEELTGFYSRISSLKMSEEQAYQLLRDKGLPEGEISKLKSRMSKIGRPSNAAISNNPKTPEQEGRIYDTSGTSGASEKYIGKDLSIFGSELFLKSSLVFEPNIRIATPSSYILGPDDELVVSVYGFSEQKYNLKVNEEGEIYIPNVGPMFVNGLSIEEATQRIRSKLASTIYRGINSGQTKVQVSLGKIRSIRVTVIGQASRPGTFTVSSLTTLYNLLYLCGGPNDMGSYRNIEIIRGNEVKRKADLYAFLVKGDQKDNILLQEGDVIRIPYYVTRVTLRGNVKREGKFEMLDTESFSDLLKYSGGFNEFAYKGAVSVIRITDTEKKIQDLKSADFSRFAARAGDEYFVGMLQNTISNRVVISGSVLRPGDYELTPNLNITELIQKAGGVSDVAYTERVSIFRYQKNRMPLIYSFNLDSAIKINANVFLQKDDSVAIHSIFDFKDNQVVNVEGNVRRPGTIKWRENLSLQDVLLTAGGVTEAGDSATIEISRRIRNVKVGEANYAETETYTLSITNENQILRDIKLMPFDLIIVKNLPGFAAQRTVMVSGDVQIPGRYGLQKSADKITDIIRRVGGFKSSADSSSITIRRQIKSNLSIIEREAIFQRLLNLDSDSIQSNPKLRSEIYRNYDLISVNLNAAMKNPSSSDNLVLEDGDILTIDKNTNLVKISGEVYYPTIIPVKANQNAKFYIKQAGNYMPSARKSGTMVIYPDGKAKSVKTFLWFKSYPAVTSRSEIFVPQKSARNRNRVSIGEWSVIVSSLAILANVISNITK